MTEHQCEQFQIRWSEREEYAEIMTWNADGTNTLIPLSLVAQQQHMVVGFTRIIIRCVDLSVIQFLEGIQHFFSGPISLRLFINGPRSWAVFGERMLSLISKDNIDTIVHINPERFAQLRRISSSMLCDCVNLRRVYVLGSFYPEVPPNDENESSAGQAICKWLHTPLTNGRPKVLWYSIIETSLVTPVVGRLVEFFSSALSPVSYFILWSNMLEISVSVELVNNITRERILFRSQGAYYLLIRCPIDSEEVEKEVSKELQNLPAEKNVQIHFSDEAIGTL